MANGGISGVGAFVAAAGLYLMYAGIRDVPLVQGLRELASGTIPTGRPAKVTNVEFGVGDGSGGGVAVGGGATSAGLIRPVPGAIGDGWGAPRPGGRKHKGVDIAAPTGTPILAALPGVVSSRGYDAGAGNYVEVDHTGRIGRTKYFHMSKILVNHGQRVSAGQTLGLVGSTGSSSGPHLHFEVWVGGQAVDPAPYLSGSSGAVSV